MMKKNIGLFWLKDDFRINKNLGLIEATKKHDQVLQTTKPFLFQRVSNWIPQSVYSCQHAMIATRSVVASPTVGSLLSPDLSFHFLKHHHQGIYLQYNRFHRHLCFERLGN